MYRLVYEQAKAHFEAVLSKLLLARPAMEAVIRTDMDQIITSKEHLASKIRGGQASAGIVSLGPTCWDHRPQEPGGPPVCFMGPSAFHSNDLIHRSLYRNGNQI